MPTISAARAGLVTPARSTAIWSSPCCADLGLGNAELVDARADDLDRTVHVLLGYLLPLRRLRLEDDLEPSLQVEAERRLPEEGEDDHADDGDENCEESPEVPAHQSFHAPSQLGL